MNLDKFGKVERLRALASSGPSGTRSGTVPCDLMTGSRGCAIKVHIRAAVLTMQSYST